MAATESSSTSRRVFFGRLLTTAGAVVLWPFAPQSLVQASEKINEEEAAAVALGYRHDASEVDTAAFPKRAGAQGARQFCDNCALFEGEPGDQWAPCSLFQGRLVARKGWCNAWVARS